jgi:hypothetical protein
MIGLRDYVTRPPNDNHMKASPARVCPAEYRVRRTSVVGSIFRDWKTNLEVRRCNPAARASNPTPTSRRAEATVVE